MGKAPAFQFYVRDWLSDPALQSCSASTRGIWINALCFMWESPERGVLTGPVQGIARLLNATPEEFDLFLQEASVTKFADVTLSNNYVTLKNRRMFREGQTRKNTKERVAKHRAKKAGNGQSNSEVTPPSSSSSSCNSYELQKNTKTGSAKSADQGVGQDDQKPKKKKRRTWKDHLAALPESQQKRFLWLKGKYPREDYLIDAVKAFKELDPDKDEWDQIVQGLEAWKRCRQWRDGRIQHMFRWLRKRLFEEKPLLDLPSGIKPQAQGRDIW